SETGSASGVRSHAGSSVPPKNSLSPADGGRSCVPAGSGSPNQSRPPGAAGSRAVVASSRSQSGTSGAAEGGAALGGGGAGVSPRSHSGRLASPGAPAVGSGWPASSRSQGGNSSPGGAGAAGGPASRPASACAGAPVPIDPP